VFYSAAAEIASILCEFLGGLLKFVCRPIQAADTLTIAVASSTKE
jgi:hypothetical protein